MRSIAELGRLLAVQEKERARVNVTRRFLLAFIRRVELDPDSGRGRAELYFLPTKTAPPTGADNAANSSLIMVAGAGFEPATSGL